MAASHSSAEISASTLNEIGIRSRRFTLYWILSRGLMLFWLMLSLWQVGASPLTAEESRDVLAGFRLASFVDDPATLFSPLFQSQFLLSYLPTAIGAHMFPVSDFTLRLPYALIGAAQMPLLLALVNRSFGKQAAVFSGLLLLGTGLFAVNRVASGPGVFVPIEMTGALLLIRYAESKQRHWLIFSILTFSVGALVNTTGFFVLLGALIGTQIMRSDSRDLRIALIAGLCLIFGLISMTLIAESVFAEWSVYAVDPSQDSFVRSLVSDFEISVARLRDLPSSWMAYAGFPVLVLAIVGLLEAFMRNRLQCPEVTLLFVLAVGALLAGLVVDAYAEQVTLAVVLVLALAGLGWHLLISQINSTTARSMVGLAVVATALAGVVWNQVAFGPQTEFTSDLSPVREYVQSLDANLSLEEDEALGLRAIAQVLREETATSDIVLVHGEVSTDALRLYAAREPSLLEFEMFVDGVSRLDGAYLVTRGEDETFNAGLSGATTIVENHRVFADGKVLYQLIKFGSNEESFKTPVWWRANIVAAKFESENTHYKDFLMPVEKANTGG